LTGFESFGRDFQSLKGDAKHYFVKKFFINFEFLEAFRFKKCESYNENKEGIKFNELFSIILLLIFSKTIQKFCQLDLYENKFERKIVIRREKAMKWLLSSKRIFNV